MQPARSQTASCNLYDTDLQPVWYVSRTYVRSFRDLQMPPPTRVQECAGVWFVESGQQQRVALLGGDTRPAGYRSPTRGTSDYAAMARASIRTSLQEPCWGRDG